MSLNFPAAPTNGQQYTDAGITYTWDGTKWVTGGFSPTYVKTTGDTMTGALNVPANASGTQAPQLQEVVQKSGDTMTGDLTVPNLGTTGDANFGGFAKVEGQYFTVIPVGGSGNGLADGTGTNNGLYVLGDDGTAEEYGALRLQTSGQTTSNVALSKKGPATTGSKFLQFAYSGNTSGSVTLQTSTSVNYNTTSDYRLKENVVPIAGAASLVNQLKPYRYNFISNPELPMLGFLAHEVQDVLPSIVTGTKDAVDEDGKDDYQQMDYSKLTPILTAALQEALARIETLEAEVAALKST